MTPERWRQITEIFHAALARDRTQRDTFLTRSLRQRRDLEA